MPAPTRTPIGLSTSATAIRSNRLAAIILLALALLLSTAFPAMSHTGLESSDPGDGDAVEAGLEEVTLTFTAPIALLEDTLVARSADGVAVDAVEVVDGEGLVVSAALGSPLTPGAWTLQWRVLAEDSHPRTGEIAITVATTGPVVDDADGSQQSTADGDPTAGATGDATTADETTSTGPQGTDEAAAEPVPGQALERAGDIARVLFYLGLLVAAGLALFKAGPHAGQSARARRLAGIALTGALVGLVAGIAEVVFHVGAVSGRGLAGTLDASTWRAVLGTGLGPALALRVIGLSMLAVGARRRVRRDLPSGPDWRKLLGALLAIGSFQYVGHTASAAPEIVVRSADLVHAVAAAIWVGGLVGLVITARGVDTQQRSITVARFSTWATGAVAGVTAAGVALAWVNLPTVAASWQTGYGRLLLGKLALVAVLLALGAHNHFKVVPDVTAGDAEAAAELRSVVWWELGLVAIVVVLTALLVNTTPL